MEKSNASRKADQIAKASEKGRKTYGFNEKHDETLPAQWWFQNSDEGLVLFIVFYTQACRWSRCLGCNLPSIGSQFHVSYKALRAQINWIFSNPEVVEKREEIRKVIVSNNGSVLDQETFSSTALLYLMCEINFHFPNVAVIALETRPEYVELEELEFLFRSLKEGDTPTDLELAVGFEAFDDHIRNEVFDKGLRLKVFEDFIEKVDIKNRRPGPCKFRIKAYFMQKPVPGMTDEKAVQDIKNAIDYLGGISEKYGVRINMHLNPTYVAFGTPLGESFEKGEYTPPRLIDVAKAAIHAKGKNISIFIGLYDEGRAVEGGSFIRPGDEEIVKKLEEFNKSQDFDILSSILEREKCRNDDRRERED